ncbi:hypothetical protein GCM10027452_44380 [Micromonospora halotolerans]
MANRAARLPARPGPFVVIMAVTLPAAAAGHFREWPGAHLSQLSEAFSIRRTVNVSY